MCRSDLEEAAEDESTWMLWLELNILSPDILASLLIGQVKEGLHEIGNGIWGIPVSTWRS